MAESFKLHCGDAFQWLRRLKSESVDLIITDPPYESLERHRARGTTTRLTISKSSSNKWFQPIPNSAFPELFTHLHRVLKRDRHFYLFCDAETMFHVKPAAEAAGFRFWKPLVWDKKVIGMGYHFRSRYEFILFFEKGKRRLKNNSQPDILEWQRIRGEYPAEKPYQVSEILLLMSTEEEEIVMDPFMGSGSVGYAALKNRRRYWGNDISEEAYFFAKERLSGFRGD